MRAFSLQPGSIVGTGLEKYISTEQLCAAVYDSSRNLKTVPQGAATIIWCATSSQLDGAGGLYCENCDIAPLDPTDPATGWQIGDSMVHKGVMPYVVDPAAAQRLWKLSEQMLALGEWV